MFEKDDRVELSPHYDAWMRGDRFGTVVKVGRRYLSVFMDKSGKTFRLPLDAWSKVD